MVYFALENSSQSTQTNVTRCIKSNSCVYMLYNMDRGEIGTILLCDRVFLGCCVAMQGKRHKQRLMRNQPKLSVPEEKVTKGRQSIYDYNMSQCKRLML